MKEDKIAKALTKHIHAVMEWPNVTDLDEIEMMPIVTVKGFGKASAVIAAMAEEELDKQPALVVARMAKLQAQLAEMRRALAHVEWVELGAILRSVHYYDDFRCPSCGGKKPFHVHGCYLKKALAISEKGGKGERH